MRNERHVDPNRSTRQTKEAWGRCQARHSPTSPRGVPRNRYAAEGYFDVWLPNLESQIVAYEALRNLSPEDHEALWGRQSFYRVFSLVNGGRTRETDLLEGIRP
jgi:hypothetical protein